MANATKVFSLEGKGIKFNSAEDVEAHIKPLREMEDVEEVRLQGNTVGIEAAAAFADVLRTKKSLQVANLADIFTGRLLSEIPTALSSLLTALLELPNLHTVNLNDNAFGLNMQAPLVAFLSSHTPLRHLYLNNNGLGPHAGILVADALSELHAKKVAARKAGTEVPDLETVICGRNRLESGSMIAWAKAFSLHTGVREVKMVQNGIRTEGTVQLISDGLRHAKGLRVLDLQDNLFTILGAKALSRALTGWEDIEEIGASDTLWGARGGVVGGKNKKLHTLRIQYNDINAKGLKVLTETIKSALPAMKRVELNGNKFSEDDLSLYELRELLEERKEKFGGDVVIEDDWGIDELDELDSDEEEEEEEEEEVEAEERREKLLEEQEQAQEEPVIQKKDKEVDELAEALAKK
ncbi:Ran GAP Rna1 [Pseudogymnoascus australis]